MAALRHPFVVPHIQSWVHHGHTVNIVYGYCSQGDLGTLLARQRVRSARRLRRPRCARLPSAPFPTGSPMPARRQPAASHLCPYPASAAAAPHTLPQNRPLPERTLKLWLAELLLALDYIHGQKARALPGSLTLGGGLRATFVLF